MQRVVADELLRRSVRELAERFHPTPRVLERRLDEDVDVFGQTDDALQRERVAPDEGVLHVLLLEKLGYSEDVLVRRCTRSLIHWSQSRLASSWVR